MRDYDHLRRTVPGLAAMHSIMDIAAQRRSPFCVGEKYKVNGTPLHNGHTVTVVSPQSELYKARAEASASGRKLNESGMLYRSGMVAAFDPAYPSTLWWWFAPHQLETVRG